MTTDLQAAKAFYGEVIGWGTQDWEGPMTYSMWTASGVPIGGLMALPNDLKQAGAPPHWLGYVGTPDVDRTASAATAAGAHVLVPPTDIPEVGRFAVLADPQGAAIALFTPTPGDQPGECSSPLGHVSWHELSTTNWESAFAFYSALFGWNKTEAMDMGEGGMYQMYGVGEKTLGGMYNKPADMPAPPYWLYYVTVADINDAVEAVKRLGGQVLNGPMEVPGGDLVAQCMDPQGAAFALHASPAKAS
ncbi:MAG: VOC family protein [Candidatus Schekmanbacteria bacterium]|nr:VOC family protein [Candidatus Schekmanbacteria bacterium]